MSITVLSAVVQNLQNCCTLGDESFSSIIYTAQEASEFYGQLHW
jgi:hypothetical protein